MSKKEFKPCLTYDEYLLHNKKLKELSNDKDEKGRYTRIAVAAQKELYEQNIIRVPLKELVRSYNDEYAYD